jgi:hypothetical protein
MISTFIKKTEESISISPIVTSSSIDKYFSSSKKEAFIKGNLIFIDLSFLEFSIYVLAKGKKILFDKYRFQYMDYKKRVVFRYDNAPHYRDISTFPLHKHAQDGTVVESTVPQFHEILDEITAFIAQSTS